MSQIIKIAIVDDDPECLTEIAALCTDFGTHSRCPAKTVSFLNGRAFLDAFEAGSFSIVFMDIYMREMDGISAALKLRNLDSSCLLIFLTSSREFMPDAFSCHAFEYMTKPFTRQRVFDVLTDALKALPPAPKYLELTERRKTVCILPDKIRSIVTDAHYLDIVLTNGEKIRCRMTMSEFLRKADFDTRFLSVNKGITVNADYIVAFENNCCILEGGARFPIRVRDRARIEQAAQDYVFEKMRRHHLPFG